GVARGSPTALAAGGGLIATGQTDGAKAVVRLWDAATGEQRRSLEGHVGRITALAFSPDGSRLFSAASDFTAKLWHTGTGKQLLTCRAHRDATLDVAWSQDGRRLASVGQDGALKVWQRRQRDVPDTRRWEPLYSDDFQRDTVSTRWVPLARTRWSIRQGRLRGE